MIEKSEPLVSLLMTSYNREKYIAEAIESALKSAYENFELIILDDNSKDRTVSIAKSFAESDPRIRLYKNETNLGQFPNRNKISEYAKGEFIIYVDSDDKIFPDGISQLVEVMNAFPQSGFGMYTPDIKTLEVLTSREAIYNHFFKKLFLFQGPGATILRRNFFNQIGKYPVNYGIPGDMYFNLKACCYTSIILIPFSFMYYREHDEQELNNSFDYLYNNYKYLNAALSELPLPLNKKEIAWLKKKCKRRFVVNIVKYFFKTFNLSKTKKALSEADFSLRDAFEGVFHT